MTTETKPASRAKTLAVKFLSAASFVSLGWMGPGLVDQFSGPDTPKGEDSAVIQPKAQQILNERGEPELAVIADDEGLGLIRTGALHAEKIAALNDVRDVCAVVKANAILFRKPGDDTTYTAAFQSCATRTLHYEASLLQAGIDLGSRNIAAMKPADLCGVMQISQLRAAKKYQAEAGIDTLGHDQTLNLANTMLQNCGKEKGAYGMDGKAWNDYVNRAVLLPFYTVTPRP